MTPRNHTHMSDTSDTTTEDVDHIVDTLLSGSHASDADEHGDHESSDTTETAENPGGGSREGAEKKTPRSDPDISEIKSMIDTCDTAIDELERKIETGRVRDCDKERVRIQRVSTLSTMLRTKKQLIEASRINELAERVAELEEEVVR